jgi:hypothetical protein
LFAFIIHKTSITSQIFIEVSVSSHASERSCIGVLGVSIVSLSTIYLLDFRTVPTVWYILELFRQCGIFWNCSDSVVYFAFHFIYRYTLLYVYIYYLWLITDWKGKSLRYLKLRKVYNQYIYIPITSSYVI